MRRLLCVLTGRWRKLLGGPLLLILSAGVGWAQYLSSPAVDKFNVRVGTQTFAPRYQFTTNSTLVETAEAILSTGSDVIKFYLGRGISGQYGITLPAGITDLTALVRNEASFRKVFDLPFRNYVVWTYAFSVPGDAWWKNGFTSANGQKEYDEIYAFTRYCLTNYNQSGKSFYLGHWEGDWYLLNNYDTSGNPSPTAIQGMIDWLNNRQRAVDDAMRTVPHTNVSVFLYTEANRVRDAMLNGPTNNLRVANAVLPYVTNLDFVSWSSYDGMNLPAADLTATLNYLEANLSTNKAAAISGRRVIIGEYGWGGTLSSAAQEPVTRAYMQRLLSWGPRFILFWEIYNNEPNAAYWLIDSNNVKTACYFLHQRLISQAKMESARFLEANGRLPGDAEFGALLRPLLDQPLVDPPRLVISNRQVTVLSDHAATVAGSMVQGRYGDDGARVSVFWGRWDGGTNRAAWEGFSFQRVNTNFNPSVVSVSLTNLVSRTNYFFRFYATNSSGEVWAPSSATFSTEVLREADYGYRLRIAFSGYDRSEPLEHFPALVRLGPEIPGFSYAQFASRAGGDLRFTDATGTQLIPHEIDEWNVNGTSCVWVKVPYLAGSNDCVWAYWGNPFATNLSADSTNGAVWSPNGELVWHLKEPGLPFADSAGKHPAIAGDPPVSSTAGMIGRAGVFNGVSDSLTTGTLNPGDRFTLSAWVKVDPAANSIQTVWANKTGGSTTAGVALFIHSYNSRDRKLLLETGNGSFGAIAATDTMVVSTGKWCHVAATVDRLAGATALYVDGISRAVLTSVRNDFPTQAALNLGRFNGTSPYWFKGTIDEARIETEIRSANWIWASWMNVASNSVFQTLSSVTSQACSLQPARLSAGGWALAWAAAGVGWRLYRTTNLVNDGSWMLETNLPSLTNSEWQIQLPDLVDTPQFYRLRAP